MLTPPVLRLDSQHIDVQFTDWTERRMTLGFDDVVGVRWQEADYLIDDADQYDGTFSCATPSGCASTSDRMRCSHPSVPPLQVDLQRCRSPVGAGGPW